MKKKRIDVSELEFGMYIAEYEIRKMLSAGAFDINPAEYIPVQYKAA